MLYDDVGFGSFGSYGSEIATPTMDALAGQGVRYNNFHVTPLCSPTRASLLTGRNHHSVGMAFLANADSGFPGQRGHVTQAGGDARRDAEGRRLQHDVRRQVAPRADRPDQRRRPVRPVAARPRLRALLRLPRRAHRPLLSRTSSTTTIASIRRSRRKQGYHLTEDLIDHAIGFVRDQVSASGEKPFFTYIAFGAAHCPHQAPQAFLDKYRGAYDEGWDVIRERRYRRQLELGIIPEGTALAPRNDTVVPWDTLSADEKKVSARLQEAFAAMVDHTDHELGRFVDYLKSIDKFDNTIFVVLADNGASQEGGPGGSTNIVAYENGNQPDLAYNLARLEQIGGPRSQTNYPHGWAQVGNTPLRRYKQNTHAGGVRAPLIVSWQAGLPARGEIRSQFHHVIDIVPTLLDLAGVERAGGLQRRAADADPRRQPALLVRRCGRADAAADAVLRDVHAPRDLARGLEGGVVPSPRQHLRPGRLGALQPRRGLLGVQRPRRAASRAARRTWSTRWWAEAAPLRRAAARRPRLSRARRQVPDAAARRACAAASCSIPAWRGSRAARRR